MQNSHKTLIIKLLGLMIFALLISIKNVIFMNLENVGFSAVEAVNLRLFWANYYGDYIYPLLCIIISLIIGLKFNIKGE